VTRDVFTAHLLVINLLHKILKTQPVNCPCTFFIFAVTTVPGILTKNPEDLAFIYESMISLHNHHPLDARVPLIPWNESALKSSKPLRVGYFTLIEGMPTVGDIETVVLQAKSHLQKLGHEVIEFKMPSHSQLWGSFFLDDSLRNNFLKSTKNDEIGDSVKELYMASQFLNFSRPLINLMLYIADSLGISTFFGSGHPLFIEFEKESLCLEILKRMETQKLDVLLCPTFPYSPLAAEKQSAVGMKLMCKNIKKRLKYLYLMHFFSFLQRILLILTNLTYADSTIYSFIWNLVNFPAGVVKFGTETGTRWPKSDKIFDEKVSYSYKSLIRLYQSKIAIHI